MTTLKISALAFVTAAVAALAPAHAAQGDKVGETQQCIDLSDVEDSPAIDSKTILVKMRGRGNYKRIDLVRPCSGLDISGFAHSTSINKLCKSDALKVLQTAGQTCLIDQIVTIDEAEAKALQKRR